MENFSLSSQRFPVVTMDDNESSKKVAAANAANGDLNRKKLTDDDDNTTQQPREVSKETPSGAGEDPVATVAPADSLGDDGCHVWCTSIASMWPLRHKHKVEPQDAGASRPAATDPVIHLEKDFQRHFNWLCNCTSSLVDLLL